MKLMNPLTWLLRRGPGRPRFARRKLRNRLLMTLVPTALIVLVLMGYATYRTSSEFIAAALERTSQLHATTSAQAV